ncbi:MAG TPA: hypothetical protein VL403_03900, partial [Candidatus Kryptonia bacterium]|nr:hypothetical protein [Candidatus Kryptonia bacterium]
MTSAILQKLIERMALANHWSPMSLDAMGHDRESGGFRRDMKHQPVGDAIAEMRVQQRDPHRFVISFRAGSESE